MPQLVITIDVLALPCVLLLPLLPGLIAWLAYRRRLRAARLYSGALAALPLGLAILDHGGRPLLLTPAAEALLSQLDRARLEPLYQTAARGFQQSSILHDQDGAAVQAQTYPLERGGKAILLILRNLEQYQQVEANYRKFLHTLSHELLTPLTSLQLRLSSLSGLAHGSGADSLLVAREDVERLTRLTSNLLILSRLEAGQPLQRRPTNLVALAEEVVLQLLERADARRISLNIHAPPRLERPQVDRDAWKQILLNLVDNAIKYGRDGGAVQISLGQEPGLLRVSVADDGPGIAAEDLPHIFGELFRGEAQRHTGGSGLGLTIVKRMVEQHAGEIRCQSAPGAGATFEISLPLERA